MSSCRCTDIRNARTQKERLQNQAYRLSGHSSRQSEIEDCLCALKKYSWSSMESGASEETDHYLNELDNGMELIRSRVNGKISRKLNKLEEQIAAMSREDEAYHEEERRRQEEERQRALEEAARNMLRSWQR